MLGAVTTLPWWQEATLCVPPARHHTSQRPFPCLIQSTGSYFASVLSSQVGAGQGGLTATPARPTSRTAQVNCQSFLHAQVALSATIQLDLGTTLLASGLYNVLSGVGFQIPMCVQVSCALLLL